MRASMKAHRSFQEIEGERNMATPHNLRPTLMSSDRIGNARAPIRIPKAAELVADEIRRMIISGQLGEGDTLPPEAQIVEDFAVSRPTVREAFRILESEQLISVSRGSRGGAKVHVPRAENVARYAGIVLQTQRATYAEVYEALILIEPPAARHVAENRSADAPAILRAVIETSRALYETDEFGRAVAAFHKQLITLTGNRAMMLVAEMLNEVVAGYQSHVVAQRDARHSPKTRNSSMAGLKSQEKLVDLIAAGDGAGAERHWRAHMEASSQIWLLGGARDNVVGSDL